MKKTILNIQEGDEVHTWMFEIDESLGLVVNKNILKSTPLELFKQQILTDKDSQRFQSEIGISIQNVEGRNIARISNEAKDLFKFFSHHSSCWFEGCEELREKYYEELDAMNGEDCKSCDKGALIRKYLDIVKKTINKINDEKNKTNSDEG